MTAVNNNRRKSNVVDRDFQLNIALRLAIFNALAILSLTIFFFLVAQDIMSSLILKYEIPLPDPSYVFIFKSLPATVGYFSLALLFIVVHSFLAIRFTNRIAGPVFSITRSVRQLRQGKLHGNLQLRSGDYGKELASEIDSLNTELKTTFSTLTTLAEEMENDAGEMEATGNHDAASLLTQKAATLRKHLAAYTAE